MNNNAAGKSARRVKGDVTVAICFYFGRLTNIELRERGWVGVRAIARVPHGKANKASTTVTPIAVCFARQTVPLRQAKEVSLTVDASAAPEGEYARIDCRFELLHLPFRSHTEAASAESPSTCAQLVAPSPVTMVPIAVKSFRLPYALRGASPAFDVRFSGVSATLSVCVHCGCTSVSCSSHTLSRSLALQPMLPCSAPANTPPAQLSGLAKQVQDSLLCALEPTYAWLCYRLGDSYTQLLRERFAGGSHTFEGLSVANCAGRIEENCAHASDMLQSKWKRLLGRAGKGREVVGRMSTNRGIYPLASQWLKSVAAPLSALTQRAFTSGEMNEVRKRMHGTHLQEQAVDLDWLLGVQDTPVVGVVDYVNSRTEVAPADTHSLHDREVSTQHVRLEEALDNSARSSEGAGAPFEHSVPALRMIGNGQAASQPRTVLLYVLVHGMNAKAEDLRFVRGQLNIAFFAENIDVLISSANENNTGKSLNYMGEQLAVEVSQYIQAHYNGYVDRLSFICHSMGGLIARAALLHESMEAHLPSCHTLLTISCPHLGVLQPKLSWVVSGTLGYLRTLLGFPSLQELTMRDGASESEHTLVRLAQKANFGLFKKVVLVSSSQDKYVPEWSARAEAPAHDSAKNGEVSTNTVESLVEPLCERVRTGDGRFVKVEVQANERPRGLQKEHVALLEHTAWFESLLWLHPDLIV